MIQMGPTSSAHTIKRFREEDNVPRGGGISRPWNEEIQVP